MGCCKYCGQGILECWSIKSADGKVFDVGCECVKKTGDAGLIKTGNPMLAKLRREKKAKKDTAIIEEMTASLALPETRRVLANVRHPRADAKWAESLTGQDFVDWMLRNSGVTGKVKTAKWLKATLAAHGTTETPLYPPRVFSFNEPGHPEGVEVEYEMFTQTRATKKVGDLLYHQLSAPGVGQITYRITRIDDTGVYAEIVENTGWILDPEQTR